MLFTNHSQMSIETFLADPTRPILIDLRGSFASDPAIPGSHRVYILDIEERTEAFEKKFAPLLEKQPMLLYCSKGDGSSYMQKKFSTKFQVQSLQGGMISYLTTISRLLHEHPYENSQKRGETMAKILATLTNPATNPVTFAKIIKRLLQCSPNPKFKQLIR